MLLSPHKALSALFPKMKPGEHHMTEFALLEVFPIPPCPDRLILLITPGVINQLMRYAIPAPIGDSWKHDSKLKKCPEKYSSIILKSSEYSSRQASLHVSNGATSQPVSHLKTSKVAITTSNFQTNRVP
jgi:hypothetical protein